MDVEMFDFAALKKAYNEAAGRPDREHVTLYIRRNSRIFKQANINNDKDLSSLRWTVDEKADLDLVKEIYKRLYQKEKVFLMRDILKVLEKEPKLLEINEDIKRKKIQ